MSTSISLNDWLKTEQSKVLLKILIFGTSLITLLCLIIGFVIQSKSTNTLVMSLDSPVKNWVISGDLLQLKQVTGQLIDKGVIDYVKIQDQHGLVILENNPHSIQYQKDNRFSFSSGFPFYTSCNKITDNNQEPIFCFGKKIELIWFVLIGFLFMIFFGVVAVAVGNQSSKIAKTLIKQIHLISKSSQKPFEPTTETVEITEVKKTIQEIYQTNQKIQSLAIAEKTASIASQIAHDIRSPLAALDMISLSLQELPEEKRLIIKGSINRIKDIANQLSVTKSINNNTQSSLNDLPTDNQLLLPLLDMLVTEKRTEYRKELGIEIDFNQTNECYGLFANINSNEFKRVFSNIINNAIEAIPSKAGKVCINLSHNQNLVELHITDNGKGIPADLLPKIGQKGNTFNKIGGSGLGLSHAINTIKNWGGTLEIDSVEGKGTTVKIKLPKSNPPNWFVPKISCEAKSKIVIIDDDQTIHRIWKGRFESIPNNNIKLISFSNPDDFKKFYSNNYIELESTTFLVDFEMLNHTQSGLDLIEEFKIQNQSILVTSRYEENQILSRCDKLGLKLIPKSMSGFVPILVS
jgi:signal transduction histidine kinase